jgi:hypothetical protein
MATETSPYLEPAPSAAQAGGWTGSDLAIGISLVVLLIAPFLPWFSETVNPGSSASIAGTADGPGAHGYLWAVFALAIAGMVALIARDALGRLPGNLPSAAQTLVGSTGLALLLTVLGLAVKPSGYTTSGAVASAPQIGGHLAVSVGWSYGGFVALVAAAVAFVAAVGFAGPLQPARGAAQAVWRRRPGASA